MNTERTNNFTRTKSLCLLRGKSDTNFHHERRILNDIEFNRRRLKKFTNKSENNVNANEYVELHRTLNFFKNVEEGSEEANILAKIAYL